MDPITVLGLVSSIAQLVEIAQKVNEIIQTFRDGNKELAALGHDVAAFTEALVGFDRILRSRHTLHRVSSTVLEDVLRNSTEVVTELRTRMLQLSSSNLSAVRRAKWVQQKSSLNKLHGKITEKMTMLHTFLSITQAETFLAIANQYPSFMLSESARQNADVGDEISQGQKLGSSRPRVSLAQRPARKNSMSSDKRGSITSDTTSYTEQLSIFSSATSIESSTTWGSSTSNYGPEVKETYLENSSLNTTNAPPRGTQQVTQDMFILRAACRYNCHCACHDEPVDKPQRRFGRSKPPKVECTDPICLGNAAPPDNSKEHSSLFRSALSRATSERVIQVRYDLKTFRMVPNAANAVRYINHGNLPKLKECIESGEATIWDTTLDGWSLLHSAAYHSHAHIVTYLLELGAATTTGDIGSRTPADLAVLKSIGKSEFGAEKRVVDIFGEKDDVLADFEFNPIHLCVLNIHGYQNPERPSLEELLDLVDEANSAPANTQWAEWKLKYQHRSALFAAILEYFRASAFESPKGTKIIHHLIDEKDKKFQWTPLHWAAYSGRAKEMRTLVDYGANCSTISNLGANIIHAAVESKVDSGLAMALKIRKKFPDELDINQINSWGETAMHIASCISASCVKLLLDAGADASIQDENGSVALHFAASSDPEAERPKILALLCGTEDTGHLNIKDFNGRPPLFDYLNDPKCVKTLVQHGAQIDVTDNEGKNAFHHACIHGEHGAVETMLRITDSSEAAATRDNDGNTPLIYALAGSHQACAMSLLQQLADLGPPIGKDGWSPIHYAAKMGEPELLLAVCQHSSFKKSAKTLDGRRAKVVAMEAGTWNGRIKKLIMEHDYLDWDD